jgi:putative membrane protein
MGLVGVLFLALIIAGVVLVLREPSSRGPRGDEHSALRILDERFARGEIDEEEYRRRRATIEG